MIDAVKHLAVDAKTATIVSTTTATTGAVSWINWSPEGLLQLATLFAMLAGGALSVVLIIVHWRRNRFECKKARLEFQILSAKEQERQEEAKKQRRRQGDKL